MVAVQVFVEGGGDDRATKARCREGFSAFFGKVLARHMPRVSPCGGRTQAYDTFKAAVRTRRAEFPVLLVDSEGPVAAGQTPWQHLAAQGMPTPPGATDDQAHLMVQCMEAWFLADRDALRGYYGQGFRERSLPGNPAVEHAPKARVLDGMDAATRPTDKGGYHKGRHAFEVLARLDPAKVRAAAPHCERLLATLEAQAVVQVLATSPCP